MKVVGNHATNPSHPLVNHTQQSLDQGENTNVAPQLTAMTATENSRSAISVAHSEKKPGSAEVTVHSNRQKTNRRGINRCPTTIWRRPPPVHPGPSHQLGIPGGLGGRRQSPAPVGRPRPLDNIRTTGGSQRHTHRNVRNNRIAVDVGFRTDFPLGFHHSRCRNANPRSGFLATLHANDRPGRKPTNRQNHRPVRRWRQSRLDNTSIKRPIRRSYLK